LVKYRPERLQAIADVDDENCVPLRKAMTLLPDDLKS
jgi:hypothetical protein